eukprot:gb/GEZN01009440.1/.p1 GENE.gb/GEZN01009440.1/~~gb/GEZN01009440.1/.p1  ORF type:complete len:187 (-),score=16.88 gb/GEZN01009440.1/:83-643(-)
MVPILRKLDQTVSQVLQKTGSKQVNLIGHSAGGWISRVYLGDSPYTIHKDITEEAGRGHIWGNRDSVHTLLTLGTPHAKGSGELAPRNLAFVNDHYPGAFYDDVRYICVAGKTVFGDKKKFWFSYKSYELAGGNGSCWGDGITPVDSALLEGAHNIIIPGAEHAPTSKGRWYGSPEILQQWVPYLH